MEPALGSKGPGRAHPWGRRLGPWPRSLWRNGESPVVIADLALVVAMLSVAGYGALVLPPDGMVPVDVGPAPLRGLGPGIYWMPKAVVLVAWPAVGVLAVLLVAVPLNGLGGSGARVGLTVALALLLLAETAAVSVAVRRGGRP